MRAPESLDLPFAVPAALRGHRTVIAARVRDDDGEGDLLVTRSPAGEVFWCCDGLVNPVAPSALALTRDLVCEFAAAKSSRVYYVCGGLI